MRSIRRGKLIDGPKRFYDPWEPEMPRIARRFIESVVYLYPTIEQATAGHAAGGTGFILGIPLPSHPHRAVTFAIAARHTVHGDGASVVRLNTKVGKSAALDLDPVEWLEHPDGDDIAIAAIQCDEAIHVFSYIEKKSLVSRQHVDRGSVGLGDPVFMVGPKK